MPVNGSIQVAFDRYLLPSTALRQSVVILDGNNQPLPTALAPIVRYDPVARTLTLSNPQPGSPWLAIGQTYKLDFPIPEEGDDVNGVRAIDRATLDPSQERRIAFVVGPAENVPPEPEMRFCRDVMPIFRHKCGDPSSGCHMPPNPPSNQFSVAAGLDLSSSDGVRRTAIDRVAQGANTSGRSGAGEETNRVFGINMPLVKPGDPGNSWLLYKVELARPPVVDTGVNPVYVCNGPPEAPAPPPYRPFAPARLVADEIEREILSDHVLGREMPYPRVAVPRSSEQQALTFDERERIRLWIAQGAAVQDCGGCGVPASAASP